MESTLGGQKSPSDSKSTSKASTKLDSPENKKVLRQLEEWYEVERIRQAPNRYQQAIDDDFYDGLQWSDEDAQELALRGQAPLVYNKVQPAVKWLTGTEKRTRIDYKILPRKDNGVNEAENLTKLLKYVQDVNKAAYARSRGFEDAIKVGCGWLECGIRGDPTKELLYSRAESWRNIIYDSQAWEFDLSDARYMFRQKWTDLDIAEALFPKRAQALKSASVYSDYSDAQDNEEWYLGQILQERAADGSVMNRRTFVDTSSSLFNRRSRVKMMECWFRKPTAIKYIDSSGTEHHSKEYDPENEAHVQLIKAGNGDLYDRLGMKMWCAIYIRGTLLQLMKSPYRHNDFPFTPIWGNRRARDHAPYGIIRVIRDPQEDFNKRMSKALHALSSRRIVMDVGAVDDIEELRLEAARPDSIIAKNKGSELEMHTDADIAEEHIKYANLDEKAIQDNSGVTDELMGHKTNAVSGIAIEKRQDQGSTVTTDFFDNLRLATQLHGQKELSLIGQYYSEEKQIRVIGSKRPDDFVTINQRQPDGSILNDITQTECDFVVDETDFKATARQAMFETLLAMVTELMKVNQNLGMLLLDDVMEFSDIPGKEEMVATIRQISGKPDPNKKLTPQEQQAAQQKAQQDQAEQDEMKQLQVQEVQGKVAGLMGKAKELDARAGLLDAQRQEIGQGDGGASDLAQSYNDKMQSLHDDTAKVIDQLRKEILVLEKQVSTADVRAVDHSRDAAVKQHGIERKYEADMAKIASTEKIAAMNDRTQEAIGKNDRVIEGLKEQEASLSQMLGELDQKKADKPTPQEEAKAMIDEHNTQIAAKAKDDQTKDAIGAVKDVASTPDPRLERLASSVEKAHAAVKDLHEKHATLAKKMTKSRNDK